MKITKVLIAVIPFVVLLACKKNESAPAAAVTSPTANTDNYSSVHDFFNRNAPAMQIFTVDAVNGGSFTTLQGTTVSVPPHAFLTANGLTVTGNVTIQFKDLYKKSDMLLANMPTAMFGGLPLKSGGEFFIKASSVAGTLQLASGKKISVMQPIALTGRQDSLNAMHAFVVTDTLMNPWVTTTADSVATFSQQYIFSLYQFNTPLDSGSWCNSDNASYFAAFTQTGINLLAKDSVHIYGTNVFLVFKNLATMIHVYNGGFENFPYQYAPQGLACTLVAVGMKSGKLYSSFVPFTISANQSVPFTLSQTTTAAFLSQLKALD